MAHQFGIDLRGIADQPDGERLPLVTCLPHLVQRLFVVDGLQSATITESDIIRWLYADGLANKVEMMTEGVALIPSVSWYT